MMMQRHTRRAARQLPALLKSRRVAAGAVMALVGCSLASLGAPTQLLAQSAAHDTLARRYVMHKPGAWERLTDEFLIWENRPGFVRGNLQMNSLGMRDREYSPSAAPNTFRIALLGSSMTLGIGVPAKQTFVSILEDSLNHAGKEAAKRKIEILNFSVGAYTVLQNVALLDRKVQALSPKAILVGVFSVEVGRTTDFLTQLVKTGYEIPYPYVQQKIRSTGATPSMEEPELRRRLGAISEDIVRWSFTRIVEVARKQRIPIVGLVLSEPRARPRARWTADIDQTAQIAASVGMPLIDLRGVYEGHNVDSLRLGSGSSNNPHWNALGHKLVADRAFALLVEKDAQALRLGLRN
jgi:hypothetical protein